MAINLNDIRNTAKKLMGKNKYIGRRRPNQKRSRVKAMKSLGSIFSNSKGFVGLAKKLSK